MAAFTKCFFLISEENIYLVKFLSIYVEIINFFGVLHNFYDTLHEQIFAF